MGLPYGLVPARSGAAAGLLQNGQVLVVGGSSLASAVPSARLYPARYQQHHSVPVYIGRRAAFTNTYIFVIVPRGRMP